jgi:antitoxin (DNA-binding transcriptional repressor) of toxin-antitoxin stability system
MMQETGKPVAQLIKYPKTPKRRVPGFWKGKVKMADDFDDLPEDFLKAFYGGDDILPKTLEGKIILA